MKMKLAEPGIVIEDGKILRPTVLTEPCRFLKNKVRIIGWKNAPSLPDIMLIEGEEKVWATTGLHEMKLPLKILLCIFIVARKNRFSFQPMFNIYHPLWPGRHYIHLKIGKTISKSKLMEINAVIDLVHERLQKGYAIKHEIIHDFIKSLFEIQKQRLTTNSNDDAEKKDIE